MILFQLLIALLIATIIYRWQKQIDRETAVLAELRKLCAEYVAASHRAFLEQPYVGDVLNGDRVARFFSISEREQEMYVLRDQLYLLAPTDIVDRIRDHDQIFRNWKISFPKPGEADQEKIAASRRDNERLRRSRQEMLDHMRLWLQTHSDQTSLIPIRLRKRLKDWR